MLKEWQGRALDIKLLLAPIPIKMQQFFTASVLGHWACSGAQGLFTPFNLRAIRGRGAPAVCSTSAAACAWPDATLYSMLACSHPPDGNDFQMEQGHFELVTQKVEGFLAHCLPSGPNSCELALFRIRLQALKNTHTQHYQEVWVSPTPHNL